MSGHTKYAVVITKAIRYTSAHSIAQTIHLVITMMINPKNRK